MQHVHFLGIGGAGASAVAAITQAQGYQVSGCDKQPHNEFTTEFSQDQLFEGHSPEHLDGVDLVVYSAAIPSLEPNNEELAAARAQGIPTMQWQEFMGRYLEEDKTVIAICGTHGKTTTTAMAGLLLEDAGADPTVEVGTIVPRWKANYRVGKSKYFVTEADEYNNNFFHSVPDIALVTNIEMDHPEFFKDFEEYKQSFITFLTSVKGTIIANMSDPGVGAVLKVVMKQSPVTVLDYSKSDFGLNLQVPGDFNLLNASAVFQLGLTLGIEPETIKKSLDSFTGTARRFEKVGEYQGSPVYSDFAHHPTELRVNLQAIRDKFPEATIKAVFQPHMFSRTHALFQDFVNVLRDAPVDKIYIADIYPSREVDTGLVSSQQLVDAIEKPSVVFISDPKKILEELRKEHRDKTIYMFLGAGDTDKWAKEFCQ